MENFKINVDIFNFLRNYSLIISDYDILTNSITTSTTTLNIELSTSASEALLYKVSIFWKHLKSIWISRYDFKTFGK